MIKPAWGAMSRLGVVTLIGRSMNIVRASGKSRKVRRDYSSIIGAADEAEQHRHRLQPRRLLKRCQVVTFADNLQCWIRHTVWSSSMHGLQNGLDCRESDFEIGAYLLVLAVDLVIYGRSGFSQIL